MHTLLTHQESKIRYYSLKCLSNIAAQQNAMYIKNIFSTGLLDKIVANLSNGNISVVREATKTLRNCIICRKVIE